MTYWGDDLTKVHTRVLLRRLQQVRAWREQARTSGGAIPWNACGDPYGCGCGKLLTYEADDEIARLKTELAKRPHVPNKAEARAVRQQKARAAKNWGPTGDRTGDRGKDDPKS